MHEWYLSLDLNSLSNFPFGPLILQLSLIFSFALLEARQSNRKVCSFWSWKRLIGWFCQENITMMRQSSSRNQRSGWWNVKHVLQICLLIAVCAWFLYQVKHSHDKKAALEDSSLNGLDRIEESRPDFLKLGRKDLPQNTVEIAMDFTTPSEEERNEEAEEAAGQENKQEENGEEEGNKAGDDSIDENDQESADTDGEDGEDFVDEEEKGGQLEELGSSDNQDHEGADEKSQEAREEHYKADDASSAVVRHAQEIGQVDGSLVMGSLDEEQDGPGKEELEDDGRTNVTRNASKDDELHGVPTDSESQMHNTTSLKGTPVVEREPDVRTLPNPTMLLESGGLLEEHGNTTSESNEHMEQQNDSTSVEPNDQVEQHSDSMQEAVSDGQVQTQNVRRGDVAETGDSSHDQNETINWNSAQEQNIADETRNLTGDNSTSEDIPFERTEKSNMSGGSDESPTTSSVADENGDAVQGEATNSSSNAVAVTEEEQEALADLPTLAGIQMEMRTVEDIAAE